MRHAYGNPYGDSNADATAGSNNAAAASVVSSGKWELLRRELARQSREFLAKGGSAGRGAGRCHFNRRRRKSVAKQNVSALHFARSALGVRCVLASLWV